MTSKVSISNGTYTIQDYNSGRFATAPNAYGKTIQFNDESGKDSQKWVIETKGGTSKIQSDSVDNGFVWFDLPVNAEEPVRVEQTGRQWTISVEKDDNTNKGTIMATEGDGEKLGWVVVNKEAVLGKGAQFVLTQVEIPKKGGPKKD